MIRIGSLCYKRRKEDFCYSGGYVGVGCGCDCEFG